MGFLEMALRAVEEMGQGAEMTAMKRAEDATKATRATKASSVPRMPDGVYLLKWNPKPAPVLLTHMAVVTDVSQFIGATLAELDAVLHSKQGSTPDRGVRELVDRLEQCGGVVRGRSCDSNNSVTRNETAEC